MNITLLSIGKTSLAGCTETEQVYIKRLQGLFRVQTQYVKTEKDFLEIVQKHQGVVVLLDEGGLQMNSHEFAAYMESMLLRTQHVLLVIGDAAGLPAELRAAGHAVIGLSPLTFPHDIARVVLLEQLYRAQTIIQNHPYHK